MATTTSPESRQEAWYSLYQIIWDTGVGLVSFAILATIVGYADFLASGRFHILLDLIVALIIFNAYLFGTTIETKDIE